LYQEVGVPLYWVVDLEAKAIEVWTPDVQFPTLERERVTWGEFALELKELFRPV
jgi:Uma2 family endonuclease